MSEAQGDVAAQVDSALREILGYVPPAEDDLTDAMDSIQRLELLIALEEQLGTSLQDNVLDGTWWASRDYIVSLVTGAKAAAPVSETG
jgi:acyl carrier protein